MWIMRAADFMKIPVREFLLNLAWTGDRKILIENGYWDLRRMARPISGAAKKDTHSAAKCDPIKRFFENQQPTIWSCGLLRVPAGGSSNVGAAAAAITAHEITTNAHRACRRSYRGVAMQKRRQPRLRHMKSRRTPIAPAGAPTGERQCRSGGSRDTAHEIATNAHRACRRSYRGAAM